MLPLFPGAGFESSLLTAVLVGLLAALLFSETVGWAFTGLVVPGYLASVFLVRPSAGAVVVLEAVLTYAIVAGYARHLAPAARLGPLFGRDRFFALLLCSIGVRLGVEGWVLPWASRASAALGMPIEDGTGLYAVGWVIVPLTANVMWVPGWRRGSQQVLLCTAVTYAVLRWLLVQYTNLAISDFELSFEDVAANFAASPKAYVVLTVSVMLATLAVRHLSWDLGGTLVPGLLAVAWLTPLKVVSTLVEVLAALAIAWPLRARGLLRGATASRRLTAAFVLLYVGKLLVALVVDQTMPRLHVTDLFGLGYLLPALLVERVWAHGSVARVLLPTVVLSATGGLLGTLVGFALESYTPESRLMASAQQAPVQQEDGSAQTAVFDARARVARRGPSPQAPRIGVGELAAYGAALRSVGAGHVERAARAAVPLGLEVVRLAEATAANDTTGLLVRERAQTPARTRGFGTLLVLPDAGRCAGDGSARDPLCAVRLSRRASRSATRQGPLLEVPYPWDEPLVAHAAEPLANALDAPAILFGGATRTMPGRDTRDATAPLGIARRELSRNRSVLRLRQGRRLALTGPGLTSAEIEALRERLGLAPSAPVLRGRVPSGRARTLVLPAALLQRLLVDEQPQPDPVDRGLLLSSLTRFAESRPGTEPPQNPSPQPQLGPRVLDAPSWWPLGFADSVLRPALQAGCSPDELQRAGARVRGASYRLSLVSLGGGHPGMLLTSDRWPVVALVRHCWPASGSRRKPRQDVGVIIVPRADVETGSAELGLALLERLDAQVLLVGTAASGAALLDAQRKLLHPVADGADGQAQTVLVIRGYARERPVTADLLASDATVRLGPEGAEHAAPTWQKRLLDRLTDRGLAVERADGRAEHAFALRRNRFAETTPEGRSLTLWASFDLRQRAKREQTPDVSAASNALPPCPATPQTLAEGLIAGPQNRAWGEAAMEVLLTTADAAVATDDPARFRELARAGHRMGARACLWRPSDGGAHVVLAMRTSSARHLAAVSLATPIGGARRRGDDWSAVETYLATRDRSVVITSPQEGKR